MSSRLRFWMTRTLYSGTLAIVAILIITFSGAAVFWSFLRKVVSVIKLYNKYLLRVLKVHQIPWKKNSLTLSRDMVANCPMSETKTEAILSI